MYAAIWTAMGILATALFTWGYYFNNRLDSGFARLGARMDQGFSRMDARFDAMTARIDTHIERHAG